jgi:hypothetical protein
MMSTEQERSFVLIPSVEVIDTACCCECRISPSLVAVADSSVRLNCFCSMSRVESLGIRKTEFRDVCPQQRGWTGVAATESLVGLSGFSAISRVELLGVRRTGFRNVCSQQHGGWTESVSAIDVAPLDAMPSLAAK